MTPAVGAQVDGRYELRREAGRGGTCAVFEAVHLFTGRSVAFKTLLSHFVRNTQARDRLVREARALGAVRHPNVVDVLDAGTADGVPFVVMEMLHGRSVAGLLAARSRLAAGDAVYAARELAGALAALHARGIVHRDIKPSNVFVVRSPGGGVQVKLLDFGIVQVDGEPGFEAKLTSAQTLLGTAEYMAFEQLMLRDDVDGRADLYALGVMLYECVTGQVPHTGTFPQVLVKMATTPVEAIIRTRGDIPRPLVAVLERALAREPTDRFADALHMADALSGVLPELGETPIFSMQATARRLPPPLPAGGEPSVAFARSPPPLPGTGDRQRARAPYVTPVTLRVGDEVIQGRSEDISEGGILVVLSSSSLREGTRGQISFALPASGTPFTCPAQVKWANRHRSQQNAQSAFGLEFLAVEDTAHGAIRQYVRSMGELA